MGKAVTRCDLPKRTRAFAVSIIRLCQGLEDQGGVAKTIGWQLIKSGTSIGANVAEGQGAQSEADFLTKYSIALKESHETKYWLQLLVEAEIFRLDDVSGLMSECSELIAILTVTCKKIKAKRCKV
jgi:four helix bundle protein